MVGHEGNHRINRTGPNLPKMAARIVEKELSYSIVGGLYEVHNELGFGFVESIYARCLEKVLRRRGLGVEREVPITVFFQGEKSVFIESTCWWRNESSSRSRRQSVSQIRSVRRIR